MQVVEWIALGTVSLWLAEGFLLAVFPAQIRQLLIEADPQVLHLAGVAEASLAAVLLAFVLTR